MPLTGGEKSLKPDSYRLIWHEREEARKSGPVSYLPFRKTGQGVLTNGEVNHVDGEPERKQQARNLRVRSVVRSRGVIGVRPEAGRSMLGQVEAFRKGGGGLNRY